MQNKELTKSGPEPEIYHDPRGDIKVYSRKAKKAPENLATAQQNVRHDSRPRRSGINLRTIGCLILWVPIILIIISLVIIFTKPVGVWGSIVDFLNAGLILPVNQDLTLDFVKAEVNAQLINVGQNNITISESQLRTLASSNLSQLKNLTVDIEETGIRFYFIIDESDITKPLYGILKFTEDTTNSQLSVVEIGTNRVILPEVLNRAIGNGLTSVLDITKQSNNKYSLLYSFLAADKNIRIDDITLQKDSLLLNINLSANLL